MASNIIPVYNTFQSYGDPGSPPNLRGAIKVVRDNVDQATNLKAATSM
jgi:hypothetical protein